MGSKSGWDRLSDDVESGPARASYAIGCAVVLAAIVLIPSCVVLRGLGFMGEVADESLTVAREQVGPRALLKKYEWFKDVAAKLDSKRASIEVHRRKINHLNASYVDAKRRDWARSDREDMNQWESELAGMIASYNDLAADYNSQMSKINWKFTNVGDLPAGVLEPLPREFRTYVEE